MFLLKRARVVQSSGTNSEIYTILSPPVCCRVTRYRPHESNIIMNKIGDLLKNDFIEKRKGPWGMVNQYLEQTLIGRHTPGMILSRIIMQRIGTN